ncbi:RNA ligase family protein [Streptomyces sp. HNM0663]|uniref:RNA ligase family protein n=1 Tax=Streptomyces chengmaiensis TaxID=3040919 RepID=A0ABT6HLG9_9ACTN|nr:RNA ligase family protein [Streptomyces chengmaiensis]MDH2389579.1 RNA ligase family protein [Streptomyces chengmaiensis]
MRTSYPRTPHLPWSPGAASDDVRAGDLGGLAGREVVVTEKLDGENTTLYADGLHARSVDSAHHPSRTWVKALQGRIGHGVPAGWRICGENMYARHSLAYEALDGYFYGFSVWDADGRCLDWDRTVDFLRGLGVPTAPVLWRGTFDARAERALRRLAVDTGRQEGYVVRTVEGFAAEEFRRRVAKWVRPGHVQTDAHWMHAQVVPNGLGPKAALWAVRSGAAPDAAGLSAALDVDEVDAEAAHEVAGRLASTGDTRLAGVLAALLHRSRRGTLAGRLAGALGLPLARHIADLVGLHSALHRPYPDEERRAGLVRMSWAVDLGVLHAVAAAVADDGEAREQVEWSALHAEEAGPLHGLRQTFADLPDPAAAARCLAEARQAHAEGRIRSVEEATAATYRWRDGDFPRLIQLAGPAGSGKSSFARDLTGVDAYVSLDELREARGSRSDQSENSAVLREGLGRLDAALARGGGTVVWDATSLNPHQRSLVHAVARRRDALITHAVALVDEGELIRRNAVREHPVPPGVLESQLRRFVPPYPGQAHRTWYIGAGGTMEEEA